MVNFGKEEISLAELYHIQLADWGNIYLTNWDANITYPQGIGEEYQSCGIQRSDINTSCAFVIDTVTISILSYDVKILRGGQEFWIIEALRNNWFRDAKISIKLVDIDDLASGSFDLFQGYIQQNISYDVNNMYFTCSNELDLISRQLPRLKYQTACNHLFGDQFCGVDTETLESDQDADGDYIRKAGNVTTGAGKRAIESTALHDPDDKKKYIFGRIVFQDGVLQGLSYMIVGQGNIPETNRGRVLLAETLPIIPTNGTAFHVIQGCPKSGKACDERFHNYENFFGFEYVPQNTILRRT